MTYNVLLGGEERLGDITAVIRGVEPDAVALLEATTRETEALAAELGMDHAIAESRHRFPRELGLHVAWLTRPPIGRAKHHPLRELAKTLLEVEVDGIRLFAAHLASRHEEAEHPRHEEVRAIVGALDGGPALFVGDLNALASDDPVGNPPPGVEPRGDAVPGAPRHALTPLITAGYTDCYRALHPGEPGYTYPAEAPWLRLDYIFASPDLGPRLRAAGVVDNDLARRASDHLPVWAKFS